VPPDFDKTECEIEITPEMIEAGISQYVKADETLETREEIVVRIFMAMSAARRVGLASQAAAP
jgi:hypothetical protein